ncbi:MAG: hypothetical protein WC819_01635 [Parcubacteria group bacterium]
METVAERFCEFVEDNSVEVVDFSIFWNTIKQQTKPRIFGSETWQEMKYFFGKITDVHPEVTDAEPVVLSFSDGSKARYDHLSGYFQPVE